VNELVLGRRLDPDELDEADRGLIEQPDHRIRELEEGE
jgi:hypothetical protein